MPLGWTTKNRGKLMVLNGAANCNSRRWRDGERYALRQAANDTVFDLRRIG